MSFTVKFLFPILTITYRRLSPISRFRFGVHFLDRSPPSCRGDTDLNLLSYYKVTYLCDGKETIIYLEGRKEEREKQRKREKGSEGIKKVIMSNKNILIEINVHLLLVNLG